jgi:hypothetical protein
MMKAEHDAIMVEAKATLVMLQKSVDDLKAQHDNLSTKVGKIKI